ncbi:MAG: CBS domain-containing protein, partial [Pseudoxanthomonas sp.]
SPTMTVQSVMTSNPASCTTSTPLRDVAQMMVTHDCGQIPVVDDAGAPVGVITDRDITVRMVASGRDTLAGCASDAMSSPAQTVRVDSPLKDAVCLMEASRIRRIPVVDASGKLAGMVSLADLALNGKDEATMEVVKEVSSPGSETATAK